MALATSGLRRCTHPACSNPPGWMNALFAVIWLAILMTVLYMVAGAVAFYMLRSIPPL